MSRKVLGIDIRPDGIAAVLVDSSLKENRIDTHAFVPLTDPAEESDTLANALQEITASMDVNASDCVISLSPGLFSFRNLQIPFSNAKKIKMVLPFELESTLPYPIDDIASDFLILNPADGGGQTDLLAVTVEKAKVRPFLESLASHKIEPEIVTLGGLALALILADRSLQNEDGLLLDLENRNGTLFAVNNGNVSLIRSFPIPESRSARTSSVLGNIRRTLIAFESIGNPEFQPREIIVTGRDPQLRELEDELARDLNIPVKALNLTLELDIAVDYDNENVWEPAAMDNALALALMEIEGLKGLNLHQHQFPARKIFTRHKPKLIKSGILAAAVIALIFISLLVESVFLNRQLNHIGEQIASVFAVTFPNVKKADHPYEQMQINVREAKKNPAFQDGSTEHIRSIDILNRISQSIPKDIQVDFTRVVIGAKDVLISGTTDEFNSVDDIKRQLDNIEFFKKVTIDTTNKDRSGQEVRFQLKLEL